MQRRDVETEDKGGQHRNISTAHAAVCSLSALCSLRPVVCTMHSAHCTLHSAVSLSVVWSAADAAFPELPPRLPLPVPLALALALLCPASLLPLSPFFSSFPSYSYSTYGVNMRPKPCHVRRIGPSMPSQEHSSSMRLLIRRSANNQRGA